jgi:hypothetical protein
MQKPHEKLGHWARRICYDHGGIIIGSAVDYMVGLVYEKPRDIDIVVPLVRWKEVCRAIPPGATVNRFGGLKFVDDNQMEVDVWADDVIDLIVKDTKIRGYSLYRNIIIGKI